MLALVALVSAGTVGPFALFAYGQSRVAPALAGTFLNLEPLVGTAAGALAFGDPFGPLQLLGGAVILAGIVLSARPRASGPPAAARGSAAERRPHRAVRLAAPEDARATPSRRGHSNRESTYQAAPLEHSPPP